MDDERLKHPPGAGVPDYFDELLERIRRVLPVVSEQAVEWIDAAGYQLASPLILDSSRSGGSRT